MLSGKELSVVSLAPQVDALRIDLVGNVNQENIEVVVGLVVRLESDLDLVMRLRRDRSLRWHEQEGSLFRQIFYS